MLSVASVPFLLKLRVKLADALGVKIAVLFREGNLVDELTLQVGDVD